MDPQDLGQYRKLGIDRLEQLLLALPEQPGEADLFVDRYIRILSKLPERPEQSDPYVGLYGEGPTWDRYREVASDRLRELTQPLSELHEVDGEIDRFIRILSDLPERPADAEPYVRLFVLPPDGPDPTDLAITELDPQDELVTAEQLLRIVGSNEFKQRIEQLTPGVNLTFKRYSINTPLRITHFLAQVMHESGGFKWLREIWGPTAAQRRYEPPSALATDLGNTQPGDGKQFMGRGIIQLTGRANYTTFTRDIGIDFGVDFVQNPELVESAPYAVIAAGWYWNMRNINSLADRDDLKKVTRAINGGLNGLEDRRHYLERAKLVFGI